MLNNDFKIRKAAQPIKSFCRGSRGAVFSKRAPLAAGGILFFLFIIPVTIIFSHGRTQTNTDLKQKSKYSSVKVRESPYKSVVKENQNENCRQYRVVSWKGDVKIRKGGKFISLTGQSKISLNKGDGIWLANGAEIELRFPGGNQKVFYGPRFTKVETLEKVRKGPLTLVNLIKSMGIEELLSRKKQDAVGGTRAGSERLYKKIKKAIPEMEKPLLAAGKEKDINEVLANVEARFDAAPMEKQVLIKARVYKHFNRDKLALMTVFNHYEKIRSLENKKMERNFIEDFLFDEFLPIVITFNQEDPDFITFSSNFELWWAAFFFDVKELKEIVKTIDTRLNPQDIFQINPGNIRSKPNNPQYLFIIAGYNSSELEKLDNMEEAKKELLGKEIPAASSGNAIGLGKVLIKIRLKSEF